MITNRNDSTAYLKLFSSIKLTKGYKQTLLVDFDRNKMRIVPNSLYDFMEECKSLPFIKVFKKYDYDNQKIINEYINFLEKHEYIMFTNSPDCFPDIDMTWKSPNYIANTVLDINSKSMHDYLYIIKMIDKLGCQALDIRIFEQIEFKNILNILGITKDCRLKSIRLFIPYVMIKNITRNIYQNLLAKNQRVKSIIFHGAISNECKITRSSQNLLFITNKIDSANCCGYVSENLMICNLVLFSEAQKYNTCLNKKLSIDVNGNVKNCSAMKKSFGHYKRVNIKNLILKNKNFTKLWTISKNDICVCKECEFRYVCIDCRAGVVNTLDKVSKCNYDPYIAEWKK